MFRVIVLLAAAVVLTHASPALAENQGYFQSRVWTGASIGQSDYTYDPNKRSWDIFANYNILNGEGGNLFIGANIGYANYAYARNRLPAEGQGRVIVDATHIPVELNLGWASASEVFNVWFGAGLSSSYTATDVRYQKTLTDGTNTGTCSYQYTGDAEWMSGSQTFFGMEWLPKTWGRRVGIWVQVKRRHVTPGKVKVNETVTCPGSPSSFTATVDFTEQVPFTATVQSLGISYHF